jgi:hypothetical protein
LSQLEGTDIGFPEDLVGPDDKLTFSVNRSRKRIGTADILVRDLFTAIFELLVQEESEDVIRQWLRGLWAGNNGIEPSDCTVDSEDTKVIRSHLEALGLMQLKR